MPLGYRNLTKGLLGNFNGVKDDDFVLPDNTILNSDLTDRQIYEDFGPKCKFLFWDLLTHGSMSFAEQRYMMTIYLCISVHPSIYLAACYRSIYVPIHLSIYLSVFLLVYLSI